MKQYGKDLLKKLSRKRYRFEILSPVEEEQFKKLYKKMLKEAFDELGAKEDDWCVIENVDFVGGMLTGRISILKKNFLGKKRKMNKKDREQMEWEPKSYFSILKKEIKDPVDYKILSSIITLYGKEMQYEFKVTKFGPAPNCNWCEAKIDKYEPRGILRLDRTRNNGHRICKSCFERFMYAYLS